VYFPSSVINLPCEQPCEIQYLQKAYLLQRGRATLRFVENQ